ncbi:MAG: hypothetical protein DMG96_24190 [Acidobacteria bacterium]|nr:MAG: hypothetical protein DMG96_24190 [Acidobacteriota bacterium]
MSNNKLMAANSAETACSMIAAWRCDRPLSKQPVVNVFPVRGEQWSAIHESAQDGEASLKTKS